jgi:hypothetical protein
LANIISIGMILTCIEIQCTRDHCDHKACYFVEYTVFALTLCHASAGWHPGSLG